MYICVSETMFILTQERKHKGLFKNKKVKSILFEVTVFHCSVFSHIYKDLSYNELR